MIAPIDVTNIRIETDRLILRPWQEKDLEDFYEYASVDGVGQRCGWLPHKSIEESKRILDLFIEEKKTLALELKENRKVIGSIGLEIRDIDLDIDEKLAGREIGYVLNKDYWGRGFMPEAVTSVIDYCFKELNFDWLTCGHFMRNDQSRRVVEKCGFRYIKDAIHHTRFGTEEPMKLYVLENVEKIIRSMSAPLDVTGVYLETERLLLRPWEKNDLTDLHEYAQLKEVAEPAGWKASETLEMSRQHLRGYLEEKESFAIVLKETGKVIGSFSVQKRPWHLYPIDRNLKGREFGFDLHSAYWGRGLAPEAARAVTDYCFRTLNYDFVTCGHFLRNHQSKRCIEKSGFKFLFESEFELPTGVKEQIRTYIRYNPRKEILHV